MCKSSDVCFSNLKFSTYRKKKTQLKHLLTSASERSVFLLSCFLVFSFSSLSTEFSLSIYKECFLSSSSCSLFGSLIVLLNSCRQCHIHVSYPVTLLQYFTHTGVFADNISFLNC